MVERNGMGGLQDGRSLPDGPSDESPAAPEAPREGSRKGFPVVGIGASAGGLAAFEAFFSGMPADTDPGMAFVVVQHLAPDHKSLLTELVRRYTRMRVFEVEDGMEVKPNCVYIIPPNRDMALLDGRLQLLEPSAPRGLRLPIDFFFRSLAQDQGERAIAIVLSGTGSDGTLGARTIKGEGGLVMAQNPESSEFDAMPRNVIATGLVDCVLPPAEMPAQLVAYISQAFGKPPRAAPTPPSMAENTLRKIHILLRAQTGHDFSQYKPSTIQRRTERRMAVQQIETMEEYVKYLQQTPAEAEALFRDLLIGVTNFFRDPEAFKALEELVIPRLFAGKSAGSAIRVWSAGCSTGEEPYSIAILLQERLESLRQDFKLQVFATDIDARAIAAARVGVYPASIAADLSPERLARFFTIEPDGSAYRIRKGIRDLLIFSEQDLVKDPPFSRLDLICCRNLLIYMGGDLQQKLISLFHYALNPGGFLFLGTSETVGEFGDIFGALDRKLKLYQRKEESHGVQGTAWGRLLPPARPRQDPLPRPARKEANLKKPSLRELTEQALLKHLALAGALVNGRGDILYLHGRTGLYLEPAPGEVGVSNILRMAREGLRNELTTALHKAGMEKQVVCRRGLRIKTNGDFTTVNLTIRPMEPDPEVPGTETNRGAEGTNLVAPSGSPVYLVVLEESPSPTALASLGGRAEYGAGAKAAAGPAGAAEGEARIAELRQELRAKEEYLQSALEELETSNEELRSSNEEMQSVNEELQSTNEELETSKEELQSVNEELATVNAELQTKVADYSRANNDMNNLLSGTGIGTVFVDHQLRILRFTPASTQIINLIQSDVGRPVSHLVSNLIGYNRLVEDVRAVLDSLVPKEVEVQTQKGAWYTMRIQPYRTQENIIEGAVITFVDISEKKRVQELLAESERKFRSLFTSTETAMALHEIVLDGLGRPVDYIFLEVNPAFEHHTGLRASDLLGKRATQIYPGIEKTDLIASYGKVALTGVPISLESHLEPSRRRCRISAYQAGPNRFATLLTDLAASRIPGQTRPGTEDSAPANPGGRR